ncbi:MAG: hypothetical protein K6A94_13500 [Bacteroidales bacterium]|nr:hypothetical protein [Bacteroidales bacterium]
MTMTGFDHQKLQPHLPLEKKLQQLQQLQRRNSDRHFSPKIESFCIKMQLFALFLPQIGGFSA